MTARTWTRDEIVALIESASVDGDPTMHLRVPAAETTWETAGTGEARFPPHVDASLPPQVPKDGAGTTSAAECTCGPLQARLQGPDHLPSTWLRHNPACPVHGKPAPTADADDADDEAMRIACFYSDEVVLAECIRAYGQAERERALREALDCCCDVYSAQDVSTRLRALLGGGGK